MREEEAIKILKEINVVNFYNTYTDSTTDFSEPRKYCDAIETILDLYNKEKEKNKNAIKYIKEISPLEVGRAPNGKMMYDHNLNQDEIYGLLEILGEE